MANKYTVHRLNQLSCRNKANAKWNLLERTSVRRMVEWYKSKEKYWSEKKQQVTSAFATNTSQEPDSKSELYVHSYTDPPRRGQPLFLRWTKVVLPTITSVYNVQFTGGSLVNITDSIPVLLN